MIYRLQSPFFKRKKLLEQKDSVSKKDIINDAIRICVKCGNTIVKKNNLGLYCKDCDSFFKWEKNRS